MDNNMFDAYLEVLLELKSKQGHCSTVWHTFSLFHINISIHVCEHHRKDLIHQGIVNLEFINLIAETDSIQAVLSHLEVCL